MASRNFSTNELQDVETHWSCPTPKHWNRARNLQIHVALRLGTVITHVFQSTDLGSTLPHWAWTLTQQWHFVGFHHVYGELVA